MKVVTIFVAFFGLLHSITAFSTGAGRCVVGQAAPQGNHPPPTDGGGSLGDAGYTITLNGNVIAASDRQPPTVVIDEEFEISVSGPDFKGFLIMLADQPEGVLVASSPVSQQATGSGCPGTASITHTSNDLKQSVSVTGTLSEQISTTIQLNIVVSNDATGSFFYYTQLPLLVIEAPPSASPTILSEAPSVIPTSLATTFTPTAPEITVGPTPAVSELGTTTVPSAMNVSTIFPTTFMPSDLPSSAPSVVRASDVPSSAPSSAPVEGVPEDTAAPTQAPFSTLPPLEDGDAICDEGFIMDKYTLALGVLLDNQTVVALENPDLLSFHVLLDIPAAVQSNYTMLREPGEGETLYSVAYEFDAAGTALLQDLGRSIGQNGYCTSCTAEEGPEYGFRAVVKGTIVDASADPPLVNISAVYPSNGTITDDIVMLCNSTEEPSIMPNVTEAPNATEAPNVTQAPGTPDGPDFGFTTVPLPETTAPPNIVSEGPTPGPVLEDTSSATTVGAAGLVLFVCSALVLAV